MDLQEAVETLTPICEAIMALGEKANRAEFLDRQLNMASKAISEAKAKSKDLSDQAAKLKPALEKVRAELNDAPGKAQAIIAAAQDEAKALVSQAKIDAAAHWEKIKNDHLETIEELLRHISQAREELLAIQADTTKARAEHAEVLASANSLSRRLAGAA